MGSCHRSPGCELVIAGFRLRLSRRPRRPPRRGIIFRFCDISRVCRQENFPSISAPRWPRAVRDDFRRRTFGDRGVPAGGVLMTALRQNISRFCNISGVCSQENFASVFLRLRREPCGTTFGDPPLLSSSGLGLGPTLHRRPLQECATLSASPRGTGRRGTPRLPTTRGLRGSGPTRNLEARDQGMPLRLQRNDHAR